MSIVADIAQPVAEVEVPPAPEVQLWRVSVGQYHEMVRQGIISENDRVELVEGLLVAKMTISPPHRRATRRVRISLERILPPHCYADAPCPITLANGEPEPDVVVVRGSDDDYPDRHPGPSDVALLVEVADTSLRYDRGFKKSSYANAAIAVYWIVNLIDRRLEVYTDPTGPAEKPDYRQRQDFGEADQAPVVLEGREVSRIPVRELLP